MLKGKFAKDFSIDELHYALDAMANDIKRKGLGYDVERLFEMAFNDFMKGKFSFDGATFFPERAYDIWEWQSFIHDWYNGIGYVSYFVDSVFKKLMRMSNMHPMQYYGRSCVMFLFTWVNIIRHKYFLKDLKKFDKDSPIYKLSKKILKK
ncbi:hypothetical protein HYO65_gp262 [Tenacibaculum phage PTm1]|uniref:Uncharacterized protein n=2 Tax=Shirahamavirus PTm1 TaxID=2846435 RepID=A0A5S9C187_9CAUD|nr:hypothetical protein HYO65_gp262 [Tenacibaculum phage PTm1]BBI90654.1 hypothetical protein [Tenacibaculum phage PTm1]BBI90959.1 hypothetical protein [Tenacibaculum phage PTm5]